LTQGVALLHKKEMNMKTQRTILFLCGLILILVPTASAQEWRKIVPLKSTRADVERILGPGVMSTMKTA
jgi:hypothetical protein